MLRAALEWCSQYASAYAEFKEATGDARARIRRLLARLPVFGGGEATRGDAAAALLEDPDDAEVRC